MNLIQAIQFSTRTCVISSILVPWSSACPQDFGPQNIISSGALNAFSVHGVDLDLDGDIDVLSASAEDDKVAWYENLGPGGGVGGGYFGPPIIVSSTSSSPRDVTAGDVDGDGLEDIVYSAYRDNSVSWIRNLGNGQFAPPQGITTLAVGALGVDVADIDGDGDLDVVSASFLDGAIAWYENLGQGVFGPQWLLSLQALGASDVHCADLNGDGLPEIIAALRLLDSVEVYMNLGQGSFGPPVAITTKAKGAVAVHSGDMNGDGLTDVLSASLFDDKLAWYPNDGSGGFTTQVIISTSANTPFSVFSVDLDGDLDLDVVAAARYEDSVVWFKNNGGGGFGSKRVISSAADGVVSVFAAGVDADRDAEVFSASRFDNKIAWYDNLMDCNGNGVADSIDLSSGASADCNGNGIPDECDILADPSLDSLNLNGVLDSCEGSGALWYLSPINGHWYTSLPAMTWSDCESQALAWGGHLVTIRSQLEHDWLQSIYGWGGGNFWMGYNDLVTEGSFVWVSGEVVSPPFELWGSGQPDDLNGSDFGAFDTASGSWMDETYLPVRVGVIEVVSPDCDGNMIPDTYEVVADPGLDCNGNGIPDVCDLASGNSPDCNGNGIADECDVLNDPTTDWNGDGVPDVCSSPNYCQSDGPVISVSGSPVIADNNFTLLAAGLPVNEYGYFIASTDEAFIPGFGGGLGTLCLGSPLIRFAKPPKGGILNSGAGGTFSFSPDLFNLPNGMFLQPGVSWRFQAWFRQVFSSNLTDGIEILFR